MLLGTLIKIHSKSDHIPIWYKEQLFNLIIPGDLTSFATFFNIVHATRGCSGYACRLEFYKKRLLCALNFLWVTHIGRYRQIWFNSILMDLSFVTFMLNRNKWKFNFVKNKIEKVLGPRLPEELISLNIDSLLPHIRRPSQENLNLREIQDAQMDKWNGWFVELAKHSPGN